MNGIVVVNKPKEWTSRDVVNHMNHILHTKKIGHTGTLDPLATGVLVLCIGKCTKLVEMITSYDKEYKADVVLGTLTDTLDVTGNIVKEEEVYKTKEEIIHVLQSFEKTYDQEVPLYSAIKKEGKKLYEYAREGKTVLLPKREVTISNIQLIGDIQYKDEKTYFSFSCTVSKGTYIRSLIRDIAVSLGTIGSMKELCRTRQGSYLLENAYTIEDIEKGNYELLDIASALTSYPKVKVSKEVEEKIKNGSPLPNLYGVDTPLFVSENGTLLALYKPYKENLIKPFKML